MILDPDGFIGTLLAIEGIPDARVVLNGPTGCRGYPAIFSGRHSPRKRSRNQHNFEDPFFFGMERIPCTYLDSDDYIHGSTHKLQEILPLIAQRKDTFVAIVNSPGASLIGDDLNRFLVEAQLNTNCLAFEGASYSLPFAEGHDKAIFEVLKWLKLNRLPQGKKRVNLLGFSMIQKYWPGNIAEIQRICDLMGLYVVATPGAGSSISEIRESTTASFNIAIYPEYCQKTADYYAREYGIPSVYSPNGAPIGFSATETWIHTVADATGCDPTLALEDLKEKRIDAYHHLSHSFNENQYTNGGSFAIRGDSSVTFPLTKWLYEYLGMNPVSLDIMSGSDLRCVERLKSFLDTNKIDSSVIGMVPGDCSTDLYFGDILTGRDLLLSGRTDTIIELVNKTGRSDFIQKTILGGEGALWILEFIFKSGKYLPMF